MFRSLRNRNYRLYAAGSAISNIGTWLQRIAQDWLVLQLTANSGTALGITTALQFLPFLLIAPWGGVIADRFPKRKVLQCTQVAMGVTAGALAVLDLTGVVQVWHVYVLAFLFGVASAIDNPARQSFVVEMVGKEDLPNAVGLNSASFNGARVIGPAVAGFLIVFVGTGWVILLNALTYSATVWALARMRTSELHTPKLVPRQPGMMVDALRYVRRRHDLLLVLAVVFFVGCFGLNFQMTSALMATQVFGKGAGEYGVLGSVMAVGAVTGALSAARRSTTSLRLVVGAAMCFGVLEMLSGVMPTYLTFALSLPILGFAQLTMITAANAMMQLKVAAEMRGRVIALYSMVFIGSTPLGAPIVGWVGEAFGARWTLIGGGAISLLGTLLATYVVMRWQGIVVRACLRPRPHLHVWGPRAAAEVVGDVGLVAEVQPPAEKKAAGAKPVAPIASADGSSADGGSRSPSDTMSDARLGRPTGAGKRDGHGGLVVCGGTKPPVDPSRLRLPGMRKPSAESVMRSQTSRGEPAPAANGSGAQSSARLSEDLPPTRRRAGERSVHGEKVAACKRTFPSHPARHPRRWRQGSRRSSRRAQAGPSTPP